MSELAVRRRVVRPRWLKVSLRQPLAVVGAVIALAWIVIAVFAPLIAPYGSLAQNFTPAQSPSLHHLFGTDELGRDVLSRVIYGSRVSIPIALLLVALASSIGCVDRRDRRLLPRARRRHAHARRRSLLRVPADHPRDGRRRGARTGAAERGARDRRRRLAVVRARRARARALGRRLGVRAVGAPARHARAARVVPGRPPERRRAR